MDWTYHKIDRSGVVACVDSQPPDYIERERKNIKAVAAAAVVLYGSPVQ